MYYIIYEVRIYCIRAEELLVNQRLRADEDLISQRSSAHRIANLS